MRSSSRANTGINGNDTAANPSNSEANAAVRFQSYTTKNTKVCPNTSIETCTSR